MNEFGDEFVNMETLVMGTGESTSIVPALLNAMGPSRPDVSSPLDQPRSLVLYFAARAFRILNSDPSTGGRDRLLAAVTLPDGVERRVLIIPAHITLWFGPGGRLVLDDDILLIIRGAIRAEAQTIFSLPEVRSPAATRVRSVVRIESEKVEEAAWQW